MVDEFTLDEKNIPEIHHLNFFEKLKVRFVNYSIMWRQLSQKQKIMKIGGGVFMLLSVIGILVFAFSNDNSGNNPTDLNPGKDIEINDPELPRDHMSPLTGEMITKGEYEEIMNRSVMTVVVENHIQARPQSGLDKADLVFETMVEGGITRFVPVYLSQQPEIVGPVRSARKYFIDFIGGYDDPIFVHIGYAQTDNPDTNALGEMIAQSIHRLGMATTDFWRVSDRSAPHNAYISTKALWQKAGEQNWNFGPELMLWEFKDLEIKNDFDTGEGKDDLVEDVVGNQVEIPQIYLNWGTRGDSDYSVTWKYDDENKDYLRFHGKEVVHEDAVTKQQLRARNVIIIKTAVYSANDEANRIIINTTGNGNALVFLDGEVIEGYWSKPTRTSRYLITNSSGEEVIFNRGVSWIMVAPDNSEIQY